MDSINHNEILTQAIRNEALRLGFTDCGFARIRPLNESITAYQSWITNGYHASMEYMERNQEKRFDPSLLVEGSKSVISLLYNYYTTDNLSQQEYKISRYAFGTDYHEVIKDKLTQLEAFIRTKADPVILRSFVDSAPVLERAWAQESGLGWIGKNTCLISRRHGSFVFLAEIITSLALDYDTPIKDYCGECHQCIDNCPTSAITNNRLIDSNKCISYQTIENKGEISENLAGNFGGFIFGCDICQDVCPWNSKGHTHNEPLFQLRDEIRNITADQWEQLNQADFVKIFSKSPVKRAKYAGILRNIHFVRWRKNKINTK